MLNTDISEILKDAPRRGEFVVYVLDNVSYYPSSHIQRDRILRTNSEDVERFDRLVSMGRISPYDMKLLNHTPVEGEFCLFLEEGRQPEGVLEIRVVLSMGRGGDISTNEIPKSALAPNRHTFEAERLRSGDAFHRGTFYTIDNDSSLWSLHYRTD